MSPGSPGPCKCLTNITKLPNLAPLSVGHRGAAMQDRLKSATGHSRLSLIRDVVVFQVKLLVDGFRDLLLVPVSIGAGVLSLLHPGNKPGRQFYELLRLGKQSEQWINLFAAAEVRPGEPGAAEETRRPPADIDDLVSRVEAFIVDEYRKGGITGQARQRLDRALESLRARRAGR